MPPCVVGGLSIGDVSTSGVFQSGCGGGEDAVLFFVLDENLLSGGVGSCGGVAGLGLVWGGGCVCFISGDAAGLLAGLGVVFGGPGGFSQEPLAEVGDFLGGFPGACVFGPGRVVGGGLAGGGVGVEVYCAVSVFVEAGEGGLSLGGGEGYFSIGVCGAGEVACGGVLVVGGGSTGCGEGGGVAEEVLGLGGLIGSFGCGDGESAGGGGGVGVGGGNACLAGDGLVLLVGVVAGG